MKRLLIGTALLVQTSVGQLPTFTTGQPFLHSEGEKWVTDGKYVNFTHADWDQDGDKDMLCGYMFTAAGTAGHIRYFENTGSDDDPFFEFKAKLPITVGGA